MSGKYELAEDWPSNDARPVDYGHVAPMIAICSYRMFGIGLAFHQIGQGLSEIGSDLQKIGLRLTVNQH